MDGLITAFKAQMYDKARSPFLTAFTFAWASWNLKTIVVILSSGAIDLKLKLINTLYPSFTFYFMQWVVYPFLSAALFILVYPLVALVAFSYWNSVNNRIKLIQVTQDDKLPTTAEEARRLRQLISEVSIEKQMKIDELVDKNSLLLSKQDTTNDMIAKLEIEKRDLSKELENKELTIVTILNEKDALLQRANNQDLKNDRDLDKTLESAGDSEAFTEFIKNLDISLDIDSLESEAKEAVLNLLNLIFKFMVNEQINVEQLKLILFILTSEETVTTDLIKRNLKFDNVKTKAIINSLRLNGLLAAPAMNSGIRLAPETQQKIYRLGVLSVPNYKSIILNLLP